MFPGVYSDKYIEEPSRSAVVPPDESVFSDGAGPLRGWFQESGGPDGVPFRRLVILWIAGSQVFLFFENGNTDYPVYIGSAQSGPGWHSEHPQQHSFRSGSVSVVIDENPGDPASTSRAVPGLSRCQCRCEESFFREVLVQRGPQPATRLWTVGTMEPVLSRPASLRG